MDKSTSSSEAIDAYSTSPRRFLLVGHHEIAGGAGAGVVAEGIIWSSGQVALHWPGRPPGTSMWSSLGEVLAFHGGRSITVEWLDNGEYCGCERVEYYGGAIWIH